MSDLLPIGVHPRDASAAVDSDAAGILYDETEPLYTTKPRAWGTRNAAALPTFQRLGYQCAVGTVVVNALYSGGTVKVVGKRPGRSRLYLFVPPSYFPGGVLTAVPAGVLLSADEGELQQGAQMGGVPLFLNNSLDWPSESGVYAGVQPGQALGVVCYVHAWDGSEGDY